jgi:hypothetical protein
VQTRSPLTVSFEVVSSYWSVGTAVYFSVPTTVVIPDTWGSVVAVSPSWVASLPPSSIVEIGSTTVVV